MEPFQNRSILGMHTILIYLIALIVFAIGDFQNTAVAEEENYRLDVQAVFQGGEYSPREGISLAEMGMAPRHLTYDHVNDRYYMIWFGVPALWTLNANDQLEVFAGDPDESGEGNDGDLRESLRFGYISNPVATSTGVAVLDYTNNIIWQVNTSGPCHVLAGNGDIGPLESRKWPEESPLPKRAPSWTIVNDKDLYIYDNTSYQVFCSKEGAPYTIFAGAPPTGLPSDFISSPDGSIAKDVPLGKLVFLKEQPVENELWFIENRLCLRSIDSDGKLQTIAGQMSLNVTHNLEGVLTDLSFGYLTDAAILNKETLEIILFDDLYKKSVYGSLLPQNANKPVSSFWGETGDLLSQPTQSVRPLDLNVPSPLFFPASEGNSGLVGTDFMALIKSAYRVEIEESHGGNVNASPSNFLSGDIVNLTAEADEGFRFDSWIYPENSSENSQIEREGADENMEVKALFVPEVCMLSWEAVEGGSLQGLPSSALFGDTLDLRIIPGDGYDLAAFYIDGVNQPLDDLSEGDFSYFVTGDTEFSATFELKQYWVEVQAESGSVTPVSGWVSHGQILEWTWSGDSETVFSHWLPESLPPENPLRRMVTGPLSITAVTAPRLYDIYPDCLDTGWISGQGQYPKGANIILQAHPFAGYSFTQWSGDITSTENPISFTIEGLLHLEAQFEPLRYPATHEVLSGGEVQGPSEVLHGEIASWEAIPKPGYSCEGWTDYPHQSTVLTLEIDGPVTLRPKFDPIP